MTRLEEHTWIGAVVRGTEMPELKHLRGVRVQAYYKDEELQDGAEDERQVPTHVIALADRREGRAPRERKPRRANTSKGADPDTAAPAAWSSLPDPRA